MNLSIVAGLLIPFLGTTAGAACVFFLKKQIGGNIQRIFTGFAAGVMVAASVWSLLDRKSTRLNSSHRSQSRMPSSA